MRRFYAAVWPRNFYNEADVVAFTSKAARDKFVEEQDYYRPNGTYHRAAAISAKQARRMLGPEYTGNDVNLIKGVNVYLWNSRHVFAEDCRLNMSRLPYVLAEGLAEPAPII